MKKNQTLEKKIRYRFKNKRLLFTALTHPSFRYENAGVTQDNQRLEFLGDSVLGMLAADRLMKKYDDASEGDLTQLKTSLISGLALVRAALEIELGKYLMLGKGEAAAGGAERESNLEDAMEALLGAVWLDGGLRAARRFFEWNIFRILDGVESAAINPKGMLQEYTQKNGYGIPDYRVIEEKGPDHDRQFSVEVVFSTFGFRGIGRSRREAEKNAAVKALESVQRSAPEQ